MRLARNAKHSSGLSDGQAKRFQVILSDDAAGMRVILHGHIRFLMVIDQINVLCVSVCEAEGDPPIPLTVTDQTPS